MIEQFSQEYIDYILSDEAKALQEKWEPKVGDRLADVWPYATRIELLESEEGAYSMDDMALTVGERAAKGYFWLPTLWDLLQIIEGAGYWWALGRNFDFAEKKLYWYDASAGRVDTDGYLQDIEDERLMLAAAKLAVRTLQ